MKKLSHDESRRVRHAEVKDIPGIISVLEQNLLAHKTSIEATTLAQTGFLMNGFTPDEAKSAILNKLHSIVLITTENDDVIGYTIGCDVKTLLPAFQNELASISLEIKNLVMSKKVLYLRHIAKKPGKKGVGSQLLQALLAEVKQADYQYVICKIAEQPIQNKASIAFHQKFGFVCMGYHQNESHQFGVYGRNIKQ